CRRGRRGPAEMPALRLPDESRWAHLPADELTRPVSQADETGWPRIADLADADAHAVLRDGEVEVLGRMPWSSNATFLVCLSRCDGWLLPTYKLQRGERPLRDLPRGTLCNRELAAREVSEALGWDIVPDTVLRDGPAGPGMMQRFIHHDPEEHYFTLLETHQD